jgi:hypothetical protein
LKITIKHLIISSACLFFASHLFAFDAHRINPVDVRSLSMGGTHIADTVHFYGLYNNPASITFTEEKHLLPGVSSIVSGPLDDIISIIPSVNNTDFSDSDAIMDEIVIPLLDMVGENGLTLGTQSSGLLTFGQIYQMENSSFGWGFMDNVFTNSSIESITSSDIEAGIDTGIEVAYAIPLNLKIPGTLSVGISGRGTYQLETDYTGAPADLSTDIDTLPVYQTLGMGIDAGIQYVIGIFSTAIVCKDIYSPVYTTEYESFSNFTSHSGTTLDSETLDTQLAIGFGIDVPIKETTNHIVSALRFYADYNDLMPVLTDSLSRNPILECSIGTEIELIDVITLRAGISENYLSTGLAFTIGKFQTNFAVYGSELGLEPGSNPQLNAALSMLITY